MAAIITARDTFAMWGEYALHKADYSKAIAVADHFPAHERAIILAEIAPCMEMEHRHGVCPLGVNHAIESVEGRNTIMNCFKASIINQFAALAFDSLAVTYIATGTNSTATDPTLSQLNVEIHRAVPSSVIQGSPIYSQGLGYWFFGTGVANATLQEWGICAASAGAGAGSGKVIARFLQLFAKTSLNTASGQYTLNLA
jgi:hypothetical protein